MNEIRKSGRKRTVMIEAIARWEIDGRGMTELKMKDEKFHGKHKMRKTRRKMEYEGIRGRDEWHQARMGRQREGN